MDPDILEHVGILAEDIKVRLGGIPSCRSLKSLVPAFQVHMNI